MTRPPNRLPTIAATLIASKNGKASNELESSVERSRPRPATAARAALASRTGDAIDGGVVTAHAAHAL